ncbi:MAG: hypothetical protein D3909_04850 [Candidatus Electrothrix sp. ATG1]|nr:hypothetical protein [Candidatus Electrothrix sp. ATG1]
MQKKANLCPLLKKRRQMKKTGYLFYLVVQTCASFVFAEFSFPFTFQLDYLKYYFDRNNSHPTPLGRNNRKQKGVF